MSNRVLPTFFLRGAPKAGTTSLYEYCAEHPEVCMSRPKETGFFFENYEKGIDWFSETHFSHYQGEEAIGEASAGNMMHREVAPRIREHCPEARLIFVLRDPVERVWSHYRFDINVGLLPPTTDFSELIRDESSEWREIMIELGMYRDHLANYVEYFDREQMRIFLFRDFIEDTEDVVRRLFDFIGADPEADIDTGETHNETSHLKNAALYRLLYQAWHPLKKALPNQALDALFGIRSSIRGLFFASEEQETSSMAPADRRYLSDIYMTPNAQLEKWLGRDLSHWS
jgi:hypothetical protein